MFTLHTLVGTFTESELDTIIDDAVAWLIERFGDRSVELNKIHRSRKASLIRPYIFKQHLTYSWSYHPKELRWKYVKGNLAQYDANPNTIYLHCIKKKTLEFTLDCLFHEFKHTQQDMRAYVYFKGSYWNHPLEKEANDFATEWLPVFWKEYENKVVSV